MILGLKLTISWPDGHKHVVDIRGNTAKIIKALDYAKAMVERRR